MDSQHKKELLTQLRDIRNKKSDSVGWCIEVENFLELLINQETPKAQESKESGLKEYLEAIYYLSLVRESIQNAEKIFSISDINNPEDVEFDKAELEKFCKLTKETFVGSKCHYKGVEIPLFVDIKGKMIILKPILDELKNIKAKLK